MASRRLEDLTSAVQSHAREHVLLCAASGIELLIYCTLRDEREQATLFGQGRTPQQVDARRAALEDAGVPSVLTRLLVPQIADPGKKKVTNACPGQSLHQYGLAYDCVPLVGGKAVWSSSGSGAALWASVGDFGRQCGLEWAGGWKSFREFPHFQEPGADVSGLATRAYGTVGPAPVKAAAPVMRLPGLTEADRLERLLDEQGTAILVYAMRSEVDADAVEAASRLAENATTLSPLWRSLLVRRPSALPAPMRHRLWGEPSAITDGVLLGRADGHPVLSRPRLSEISDGMDIVSLLAGA